MHRRSLSVALVVAVLLTAGATASAAQTAPPSWAPAADATVHPGVQTFTDGAQCTANFVFYDAAGEVYVGQAAHCAGTGESTATDGCESGTLPVGTPVEVDGAEHPATMVYSSWVTMQELGETDDNACAFNDFALVRLDPRDRARVNPSVPFYGGPVGLTDTTLFGDDVYSYGNSSLRFGARTLSPKQGTSLGQSGDGWTHTVYTVSPGVPGDSGSGFLDIDGRAFGVLSTLEAFPRAASNGVSDLARALDYLARGSDLRVTLADGTEPFEASALGGGGGGGGEQPEDRVERLAGPSRIETAVAVSQDDYAEDAAGAVVLARADEFADALAATPLAASVDAPLLLTPVDALHPATRAEIERVLARGATVYVLGGPAAIAPAVADELAGAGYEVRRLAGGTRVETALAVADVVADEPAQVLLADGQRFPDALIAGPAAHAVGGVVVLTAGSARHPAVDAYLAQHRDAAVVTVGAAASAAYPGRTSYVGDSDEATSVQVAEAYRADAATVGVARVDVFADALSGGAHSARTGAPILLTGGETLTPVVADHLRAHAEAISTGVLYGGTAALPQHIAEQVLDAIR
jgi:hypothetical protein